MALAVVQYAQDYDERFPMGEVYPWNTHDKACATAGANSLGITPYKTMSATQGTPIWMAELYPYTRNTQMYYCPSGPTTGDASDWKSTWPASDPTKGFSYAYNPIVFLQWMWESGGGKNTLDTATCDIIGPQKGASTLPLSRLVSASTVVMLADRGQTSREALECSDPSSGIMCNCGSASCGTKAVTGWLPGNDDVLVNPTQGTNPARRHFEGANFCFADGHVKWLSYEAYLAQKTSLLSGGVS